MRLRTDAEAVTAGRVLDAFRQVIGGCVVEQPPIKRLLAVSPVHVPVAFKDPPHQVARTHLRTVDLMRRDMKVVDQCQEPVRERFGRSTAEVHCRVHANQAVMGIDEVPQSVSERKREITVFLME